MAPHLLVTSLGTVSHTGAGVLTTGGGFGGVARRFGLALDNVTGMDVVTADGKLLRADERENPDLYWGVRGGGGNFGIVTTFRYRLHPMAPRILGGDVVFPFSRAADVLAFYGDYHAAAPEELYLDLIVGQAPGADPTITLHACYSGPPKDADKTLAPIRKLGTPLADGIKPTDYVAIQRSTDIKDPRALGMYLKSGFPREHSAALSAAIRAGFPAPRNRLTEVMFQHAGGAIGRVPTSATAFAHRYARTNLIVVVGWPAAESSAEPIAWARQYWKTLEPLTEGFYTNEVEADHTAAVVNANYRENYARLVTIKAKYDPANLFRLNANIKPVT
jgi:FAD/FMN-containing dehydrogenase